VSHCGKAKLGFKGVAHSQIVIIWSPTWFLHNFYSFLCGKRQESFVKMFTLLFSIQCKWMGPSFENSGVLFFVAHLFIQYGF